MRSNRNANNNKSHYFVGGVVGGAATAGLIYGNNAVQANGGYKATYNQATEMAKKGTYFTANKAGNAIDGALYKLSKMRLRGR